MESVKKKREDIYLYICLDPSYRLSPQTQTRRSLATRLRLRRRAPRRSASGRSARRSEQAAKAAETQVVADEPFPRGSLVSLDGANGSSRFRNDTPDPNNQSRADREVRF